MHLLRRMDVAETNAMVMFGGGKINRSTCAVACVVAHSCVSRRIDHANWKNARSALMMDAELMHVCNV